jgi:hypothetical protein
MLKDGDVILEISNLNRELTVLSQEASFQREYYPATRYTIVRLLKMI